MRSIQIIGLSLFLLATCWFCFVDVLSIPGQTEAQRQRLKAIDRIVEEGIRRKQMPGCVVAIGSHNRLFYLKSFGNRQLKPTVEPMTDDTLFDLASLTKPLATGFAIMKLADTDKLKISDPASKYWPEFGKNGKSKVTIEQLLLHTSGLIADNSLKDYKEGSQKALQRIANLKLIYQPGTRFVYSDVGYIVLGEIVHRVSGTPLDKFCAEHIFNPLGMDSTGFRPSKKLAQSAAPTEKRSDQWIKGEVHDPRAYRLNGVAGHAGLFSTARDLSQFCRAALSILTNSAEENSFLTLQQLQQMTLPRKVPNGWRTWGWDNQTGYSINRGDLMSTAAFGHGGFTGTGIWIDPKNDVFVVFLSNRLHPNGKGSVNRLIGRIGTVAIATFGHQPVQRKVLQGIDILKANQFRELEGKKIGLITNQTGVCSEGKSTIDLLHRASNVELDKLFNPEHGIAGTLDERVKNSVHQPTGLKITSLYGSARKPSDESLKGLDALVFDIQDIGTRFYTYMSTMCLAMEAATKNDIEFIILDRINPINGVDVSGPILDAGSESFVSIQRIPIRHGMTAGELALMYATEKRLKRKPTVIKVQGWSRNTFQDQTNVRWINPSPNIRNLNQALIYPGLGMLETTNLSVGRGTDCPFERVGAPWIDGTKLANALNSQFRGIKAMPIEFQPNSSKFRGKKCSGVQFAITDRSKFAPVESGLQMALTLKRLYPDQWQTKSLNRLIGNRKTVEAIEKQQPLPELLAKQREAIEAFQKRRARYLLY